MSFAPWSACVGLEAFGFVLNEGCIYIQVDTPVITWTFQCSVAFCNEFLVLGHCTAPKQVLQKVQVGPSVRRATSGTLPSES